MPEETTVTQVKDTTANPAPLGLMGFGMTTVLLNLHNAGLFPLGTMILGMGIFYGGLCQIFAGLLEWKKGNTFGTTAFASYGAFWLSFVALLLLGEKGLGVWESASNGGIIAYLVLWGIFTFVMFIGTLRLNRALQTIFLSLTVLFFLLAAGDATGNQTLKTFTGYEGIFCGASAIYTALALLLNEVYGRTILPIGPVKK